MAKYYITQKLNLNGQKTSVSFVMVGDDTDVQNLTSLFQSYDHDGSHAWILLGLCLSLAGDVLLMLPSDRFIQGLAAFLVAHLCYNVGFAQGRWCSIWWMVCCCC